MLWLAGFLGYFGAVEKDLVADENEIKAEVLYIQRSNMFCIAWTVRWGPLSTAPFSVRSCNVHKQSDWFCIKVSSWHAIVSTRGWGFFLLIFLITTITPLFVLHNGEGLYTGWPWCLEAKKRLEGWFPIIFAYLGFLGYSHTSCSCTL